MDPTETWEAPVGDRVREHTAGHVNQRIDRETVGAIALASKNPDESRARMRELDREWNVDRALFAWFSVLGSYAAWKGMRSIRRTGHLDAWGALFWTQMGFLMHHAIRGWCPPVSLFRRLGFRTAPEIAAERAALVARLVPADRQG